MIVAVTTHPFGASDPTPVQTLRDAGHEVRLNPHGRKMCAPELQAFLQEADAIIAGTDRLTPAVLGHAPRVQMIARLGIGLDGIDWPTVQQRGIRVTYTPDGPTVAVAELALALMLNLLRQLPTMHTATQQGQWQRQMGGQLSGRTVGILGLGRTGKHLAHLLAPFGTRLLAHDVAPDMEFCQQQHITHVPLDTLLRRADILSLHTQLTEATYHVINAAALAVMQPTAFLINTARGALIDEVALLHALQTQKIAGAALDVFETEPYQGPLCTLDTVLLSAHIGAYTREARCAMEAQTAEEVIRFFRGDPAHCPAPSGL